MKIKSKIMSVFFAVVLSLGAVCGLPLSNPDNVGISIHAEAATSKDNGSWKRYTTDEYIKYIYTSSSGKKTEIIIGSRSYSSESYYLSSVSNNIYINGKEVRPSDFEDCPKEDFLVNINNDYYYFYHYDLYYKEIKVTEPSQYRNDGNKYYVKIYDILTKKPIKKLDSFLPIVAEFDEMGKATKLTYFTTDGISNVYNGKKTTKTRRKYYTDFSSAFKISDTRYLKKGYLYTIDYDTGSIKKKYQPTSSDYSYYSCTASNGKKKDVVIVYPDHSYGSLYIDGKEQKLSDFITNGHENAIIKINKDFYLLDKSYDGKWGIETSSWDPSVDYMDNCIIYDVLTKKSLYNSNKKDKNLPMSLLTNKKGKVTKLSFYTTDGVSHVYDGKKVKNTKLTNYTNLSSAKKLVGNSSIRYFTKNGYLYTINYDKGSFQKKTASSLIIYDQVTELNSVGGFSWAPDIYNNSSKTIKYIYFKVHVKNRVNDTAYCTIRKTSSFDLKFTGPLGAGESKGVKWKNILYNNAADRLVVDSVTVEYMDGSKAYISGSNITCL